VHLQQTKHRSRASGGPQYSFHDLKPAVKDFLRRKGACDVVLETPYGIAESPFIAVGKDHKIGGRGRPVAGSVGHDRIQQGAGSQSIGEAIRRWYGISTAGDFERIDVDVSIHPDGHFILTPLKVRMRSRDRAMELRRSTHHLSFHHDYESRVWRDQIEQAVSMDRDDVVWAASQMEIVLAAHSHTSHLHEADLLRAAGALSKLGVQLGPWLVKSYDCPDSRFRFLNYSEYVCPVEIKKASKDFQYRMEKYHPLPRAVILCVEHDLVNMPAHIDVIEMRHLSRQLRVILQA
jgi:hypothetical protein